MAKNDKIKSGIINRGTSNPGWYPKGKSGNPSGRPKKRKEAPATDPSVRDEFLKAADSTMKLTENGKELIITQRQAVQRSELVAALKGSSHAQRNYLARDKQFRRERLHEVNENHQYWRKYVAAFDEIVRGFADRCEPMPDHYPHPDELNFAEGKLVTGWLGGEPIQAALLRAHYVRLRDVFLLQAEKDRRYFGSNCELDHVSGMMGLFINVFLPKAAQLDEVILSIHLSKQRVFRKRELQRRLAAAWADVGCPEAKQMTTPPFEEAARRRALVKLRERLSSFCS